MANSASSTTLATIPNVSTTSQIPAEQNTSLFGQIPNDVFFRILESCDIHDVLRYRSVCRLWNQLTNEDNLWLHLYFSHFPNNYSFAIKNFQEAYKNQFSVSRGKYASYDLKDDEDKSPPTTFAIVNKKLYSGHKNGMIKEWDFSLNKCTATFEAHKTEVNCLTESDNKLYSASDVPSISVLDPNTRQFTSIINGPYNEKLERLLSRSVSNLAILDKKVFFQVDLVPLLLTVDQDKNGKSNYESIPCGSACTIADGQLFREQSKEIIEEGINTKGLNEDEILRLYIQGKITKYHWIECYDIHSREVKQKFENNGRSVEALFVSTGQLYTSKNKTIKIWDTNTSNCMASLKSKHKSERLLAVDGYLFTSGHTSFTDVVDIWDLNSGECKYSFLASTNTPLAFIDGKLIFIKKEKIHVKDFNADDIKIFEDLAASFEKLPLKRDDHPLDRFSKMPESARNKIYGKLYEIIRHDPGFNDYWGCAEDAFHNKNGQNCSDERRAKAIREHLSDLSKQQ